MGCDIHLYPEVKKAWGWQFIWRFQADDDWKDRFPMRDRQNYFGWQDRNYALFAKLAGVRVEHNISAIVDPRGVPGDADYEIKKELHENCYHSCSWLTLEELEKTNWDIPKDYTWDPFKEFRETTMTRLKELGPSPENIRMVFGFDN